MTTDFPRADVLRKQKFDLKAWVQTHRAEIEKDLTRSGRSRVEPGGESERRQVREFFESLGYTVKPGTDYRNETDGSLIISF